MRRAFPFFNALAFILVTATSVAAQGQGYILHGVQFPGSCGDGHIDLGEECDAHGANTAVCNGSGAGSASCKTPTCADGYLNTAAGEQCVSGACCDISTCRYRASGYVCRTYTDNCDPVEICSGSSTTCPADIDNCLNNCGACSGGSAGTGGLCINQQAILDTDAELTEASVTSGTCDGASSSPMFSWANSANLQDDDGSTASSTGNESEYTYYAGVKLAPISMAAGCEIKFVSVSAGVHKSDGVAAGIRAWVIDDGAISDSTYVDRNSLNTDVATTEAAYGVTFSNTLPTTSNFINGDVRVGLCGQFHSSAANQTLRIDYIKATVEYGPP